MHIVAPISLVGCVAVGWLLNYRMSIFKWLLYLCALSCSGVWPRIRRQESLFGTITRVHKWFSHSDFKFSTVLPCPYMGTINRKLHDFLCSVVESRYFFFKHTHSTMLNFKPWILDYHHNIAPVINLETFNNIKQRKKVHLHIAAS